MIILLNGPINSGKSAISRLLCEILPSTVHIEVDEIRKFVGQIEGTEGWKISFEAAVHLAKCF